MSTPQTASTVPPEAQELLLFVIGQLFRACTVYEEALDTIQSPALKEHMRRARARPAIAATEAMTF